MKEKIRILRIVNRFNLGGISYNVSYLSKYLAEEYETMLIGGPHEEGEGSSLFIPRSMGLDPKVIEEMGRNFSPLNDWSAYRKIAKIIREFKPHIVHTHASKAGWLGRQAAHHGHVPLIVHTFHGHVFEGYFSPMKTALIKKVERNLAKKSDAIVAISELQKKDLSLKHHICDTSKIHVIPLGFDLERFTTNQPEKRNLFRAKYSLRDGVLALGIIGRLAPIKDHLLFIDSIVHLKSNSPIKLKGIIIGDGEMKEELMEYAHSKNLKTNGEDADILFTGWCREVDKALPGLDIVCLTSKNEGTPVSLIEAQAAGKFVVSTDVGGIRDVLHPQCGLLSDRKDRHGYMENLRKAVTDFDRFNANARIAQKETLEKFSFRRLCNDADQLYKKLLHEKNQLP